MSEPVNVAYNMDCMEYMRSLPDKAFDLAVVDPPYGDGNSQSVNAERERERGRTATTDSAAGGTDTKKYNRFGQRFDKYKNPAGGGYHGKDKYHLGQPGPGEHVQESRGGGYHGKDKYHLGQPGPGEHGRQSTVKK